MLADRIPIHRLEEACRVRFKHVSGVKECHRPAATAGILITAPSAFAFQPATIEYPFEQLAPGDEPVERFIPHISSAQNIQEHRAYRNVSLRVDRDPGTHPASDRRVVRDRPVNDAARYFAMQLRREKKGRIADITDRVAPENGMKFFLQVATIEGVLLEVIESGSAPDKR